MVVVGCSSPSSSESLRLHPLLQPSSRSLYARLHRYLLSKNAVPPSSTSSYSTFSSSSLAWTPPTHKHRHTLCGHSFSSIWFIKFSSKKKLKKKKNWINKVGPVHRGDVWKWGSKIQRTGAGAEEMKVTWLLWVSEHSRAVPPNWSWMSWIGSSILYSFHCVQALTVGTLHSSQWANALKLFFSFFSCKSPQLWTGLSSCEAAKTHTCTRLKKISKNNIIYAFTRLFWVFFFYFFYLCSHYSLKPLFQLFSGFVSHQHAGK